MGNQPSVPATNTSVSSTSGTKQLPPQQPTENVKKVVEPKRSSAELAEKKISAEKLEKKTSAERADKKGSGEKAEKRASSEKDENQYEALPDLETIQNAENYREPQTVGGRVIGVAAGAAGLVGTLLRAAWRPWTPSTSHRSLNDQAPPRSPSASERASLGNSKTPTNSPAAASLRDNPAPIPTPAPTFVDIRPPEDKRSMVKWNNPQYDTLRMGPSDANLFVEKPKVPTDKKATAPLGADNYKTLNGLVDPFDKK